MTTTVPIDKLTLAQLSQLKQQLDQEVDLLSSSLQQLKGAQNKFQESKECLEKITPECDGKDILIPLTSSTVDDGKDYCKRKVKFLTTEMEKIQKHAQQKIIFRDAVIDTMESKLQATLAAQKLAGTPRP